MVGRSREVKNPPPGVTQSTRGGKGPAPFLVIVCVIVAALVAWIVSFSLMSGMSQTGMSLSGAPMRLGTGMGSLVWFLGMWVTMMAAMMLPSFWPMVLAHVQATAGRAQHTGVALSASIFTAGYLLAWTGYGLIAYVIYRGIGALQLAGLSWISTGPYLAGAIIVIIGVYQLTPLKRACLRHCRSPLHFMLHGWRPGLSGALRMGVVHGIWCVGCCAGLMLLLFVLGVMSLGWMGILTAVVFAEKLIPSERIRPLIAVGCIVLGAWVAVAPGTIG